VKYIIFERPNGLENLVVFDELTSHVDMKNKVNRSVLGAGMIYFGNDCLAGDDKGFSIYNGSVSLGISYSKDQTKKDTQIIARLLEFRG